MKKLRQTMEYILDMREEAWDLLMNTLRLCCVMLLCAFAILVDVGSPGLDTLSLWRGAEEYSRVCSGILLCGVLASAFLDTHLR